MKGKFNQIHKYELIGLFSRCYDACFRNPILPEILKIIARNIYVYSGTYIKGAFKMRPCKCKLSLRAVFPKLFHIFRNLWKSKSYVQKLKNFKNFSEN